MDSPGHLSDNESAGGGGEKRSSGTSASGLRSEISRAARSPLSNAPSMLLGQLPRSVPAIMESPVRLSQPRTEATYLPGREGEIAPGDVLLVGPPERGRR